MSVDNSTQEAPTSQLLAKVVGEFTAQLEENLRIADEGIADSLEEAENAVMDKAKNLFRKRIKVDCTGCEYCLPCPCGVNIPGNFLLYNSYNLFDDERIKNEKLKQY